MLNEVLDRIAELEGQAELLAGATAAAEGENVQPARDALHAWDRDNQAELHRLRRWIQGR